MSKYSQKGSTYAVIVVILVVALLGALGFIFWQNVNKKATPPISQETEITNNLLTISFNEGFQVDTSIKYPKDWTLERSVTGSFPVNLENGPTTETLKIISPSKKYFAQYKMSAHGGIGGMCAEEETGVIKQISLAPANFYETAFIEAIATTKAGKFVYYAGLMDQELSEDDSTCGLYLAALTHMGALKDGTAIDLFEASVHIEGLNDPSNLFGDDGVATEAEIESAFKNSEYQQAKAIIASTEQA